MVYTHTHTRQVIRCNNEPSQLHKCGKVTCHCRKARPHRAHLSLFLSLPVLIV